MAVPRKQYKQYTANYKREGVRLMTQGNLSNLSAAQVARDLGINANLLGKCKRQLEAEQKLPVTGRNGQVGWPGQGHLLVKVISWSRNDAVAA